MAHRDGYRTAGADRRNSVVNLNEAHFDKQPGRLAQLVERILDVNEVRGSSPLPSTNHSSLKTVFPAKITATERRSKTPN